MVKPNSIPAEMKQWGKGHRNRSPWNSPAARVAELYFVVGILWILSSDFTLIQLGGLTASGVPVSIGKGAAFVFLSTGLVYWLCLREYQKNNRVMSLLHAVVEGTSDAVFVKDREGKYLLLNSAAARFMGCSIPEALGHDDSHVFEASQSQQLMARDQKIMEGGQVVTIEETLTSEGITRVYQATKGPFVDDDGTILGLIGVSRDITEQRQAHELAHERELLLQNAVEIAELGIIEVDYRTQNAKLSARALEQFGFSPSDRVTRAELHARIHVDDFEQLQKLISASLDPTGSGWFACEHRVCHPDGAIRWLNVRKQVSFSNGTPERALVVTIDVTERKQAEARFHEQELLIREAAELAIVGGWGFDPFTLRSDWTPAVARMYGLDPESPPPVTGALEFFSDQQRPALEAALQDAMQKGTPHDMELELKSADGQQRWVRTICRPIVENGKVIRVRGSLQDITDRKRVEAELRKSGERYRLLFESNPHPMWVFDLNTLEFQAINDAAIDAYGYSREEFLQRKVHDIESDKLAINFLLTKAHDPSSQLTTIYGKHRRKDGSLFEVELSCHDFPQGNGLSRLVMALDISARKKAETELYASERRLRLALDAAGASAFVWDIPNDSITGYYSRKSSQSVDTHNIGSLSDVRQHILPEDLPAFDARLNACLEDGTDYRNQYRIVTLDGKVAYFEDYGFLERSPEGVPLSLTGMVLDVTERVVFNEALRSSEERLREAAYVAGFGVFEHEHRTDTLFWSKQLREIYGVPMDTTPSLDLYLSMVHADDLSNVEIAVRRAHDPNGDGRFEVEHRLIRHGDGEIRWIATQAQTQFAGEGQYRHPLRTVGATLDVTEARAAAEALQTSETRYRQLVDMLPTGILVHSDNEILYGNPALLKLVGAIDSLQILHRSPYDYFHPSSHALLEDLQAEKDKQNPSPSGCEAIGLRCDGRSFPVHITSCPIEGYDQPTTLFALSDLTELERSAALLRSVLDSVDDAIFTVNGHGKLTSANRSTLRLFGYQESELLDQPVSMLLPDTKIADLSLTLADHAGANHANGLGIACDVNGTRNDGSTFPAELTITEFLRNGDRELTGVLRDITAKRQLEEQFRQAQKMEAIGRLAGGVAHDFNNLLTVINGYSSIVLTYSPIDEKARGPIEAIQDAGDRAARLTQQLLAFSRKSLVEPRLIDLNELVVESSKLLRRLISEDIAFSILVAPNPVYLVIDPGHIEQVLMNLVVNARDSMPTGGRLSIKTELVDLTNPSERLPTSLAPGWYASMVVTDSGSGMSPSVMEKIFEPFFTTKELGKGTGLGLAVVHGLVEQSGGSIAVESTVGMGTTFRILLPAASQPNLTHPLTTPLLSPRGGETILVTEDEDAVRTLVRVALETQGYTVITASSGKEALHLLRSYQGTIDLVITDVIMPGMSGRELVLAAREFQPHLRVLYMSGYTDDALVRYGLEGEPDHFIGKPFTPFVLSRKIRTILDVHE